MIEVVQGPQSEPLSAADEVIPFLRESTDVGEQLALISIFITAARQAAESELGRYLITQTLALQLDRFPCADPRRGGDVLAQTAILLPPLQDVTTLQYVDTAGATQTLDSANYLVDAVSKPARMVPAYATTWPATRHQPSAVKVTFEAGYGDKGEDVPASVKHWMLLAIKAAYDSRDRFVPGMTTMAALLPDYVNGLLDPERVHGWR